MRQIKFKVFDKQSKTTHIVGTDQHDSLTCFGGEIGYYNLQNGEGSGENGDYILMQYTGLKDKNGVEVYEWDILPCGDKVNGKVIFEEGLSAFSVEFPNHKQLLMDYRAENFEGFEVIGNVHQHPHLLGEVAQ